jgi:hypothetical protein
MAENDKQSAEQLRKFLLRLASEHELLFLYMQDSRAVASAAEHGLEEEHIELIVAGDTEAIRRVLKEAGFDDEVIRGTGIIVSPVR